MKSNAGRTGPVLCPRARRSLRPLAALGTARQFPVMPTPFRTTLWRVLLVQLVTLGLLWLLQARYHALPG